MSSKFVHHRVVTPFWFSVPNVMAMFRWGSPHGANNADKVGKNCDSRRISGYRIDDCCSANNNGDGDRAVYRTDRHASVILFITTSMGDHDEEKRRE